MTRAVREVKTEGENRIEKKEHKTKGELDSLADQVKAIPISTEPLKRAALLEPILKQLAEFSQLEAQAFITEHIVPHFALAYYDTRDVRATAKEMRRQAKKAVGKIKPTQPLTNTADPEAEAKRKDELLKTKTSLFKIHAALAEVSSAGHDTIELAMAVVVSAKLSRQYALNLVWVLIVSPPSSLKTFIVTILKGVLPEYVFYLDTLTENAFVTGYVPESGEPQDLLPRLDGRCLVIKDMTTLFSLRDEHLKKVLGELQSIYDGSFAKFSGIRGEIRHEASFSFLGCVTPVALSRHHGYMSMIGTRFLQYREPELTEEQMKEGFNILWQGSEERKEGLSRLRLLTSAYVVQLLENPPELEPETGQQQDCLNKLGELLARARSVVQTEYQTENASYKLVDIQTEKPFRIVQQLTVLERSLTIVHGRSHLTGHELNLVRRVVLSSMPWNRASVLRLFQSGTHQVEAKANGRDMVRGLSVDSCANGLDYGKTRARQLLDELRMIGILDHKICTKGEHIYVPVPEFDAVLREEERKLDHFADLVPEVSQNIPVVEGKCVWEKHGELAHTQKAIT